MVVARACSTVASIALVGACAAVGPARGAVVLVVDANVTPGLDFDTLRVHVGDAGEVVREFHYAYDAASGEARALDGGALPFTLTLQNAEDSLRERAAAVTAWKSGAPVFAREARFVVPASATKELRLTVEELCFGVRRRVRLGAMVASDWANAVDERRAVSCGGDGLTCVGGACVPTHVDVSSLEPHVPERVFGGRPGPAREGRCADLRACFTRGATARVPPVWVVPRAADDGCTVSVPSGIRDPDELTVAYAAEPGRGSCGPGGCVVRITRSADLASEPGFVVRGDRLVFPDVLCATHRRVYVSRSREAPCAGANRATPVCASWSSVGAPPRSGTAPEALAVEGARDDGALCGAMRPSGDLCAASGVGCGSALVVDDACADRSASARYASCGPCDGPTEGMAFVRGGFAVLGAPPTEPVGAGILEEGPEYAALVEGFWIDRTEVTAEGYAICAARGGCPPVPTTSSLERDAIACNGLRASRAQHPMNCVTWSEAAAYCRWRGKRLPTEEEWEFAARGGARSTNYPWGNGALPSGSVPCVLRSPEPAAGFTCAVGARPNTDSPDGVSDLVGNVREWTASAVSVSYARARVVGGGHVARGSGWSDVEQRDLRVSRRINYADTVRLSFLGFRCAKEAEP